MSRNEWWVSRHAPGDLPDEPPEREVPMQGLWDLTIPCAMERIEPGSLPGMAHWALNGPQEGETKMSTAQEILEAWDDEYSVSLAEMVRTRGGWVENVTGEYGTGYFVYLHLPDGSLISSDGDTYQAVVRA